MHLTECSKDGYVFISEIRHSARPRSVKDCYKAGSSFKAEGINQTIFKAIFISCI